MAQNRSGTVVLTVLATLTVLLLGGVAFIYSGIYNVAATEQHTALGAWVLNTAMERSVAVRAGDEVEPRPESVDLEHGFEHFREMCVDCHGAPGVEKGDYGKGITPEPPELSDEAEEFSSEELFWIVKHGIKLAGMPAFGPTHSDEELWAIVAFVERLPTMSPEEYQGWEERHSQGSGEEHTHPADTLSHAPPGDPPAS